MIERLTQELLDSLDPPTAAAEERWRERIYDALDRAYYAGYDRGKDHGEESMKSWLKGGYE